MEPQDSQESWGFFAFKEGEDERDRDEALHGERAEDDARGQEAIDLGGRDAGPDGRPEVLRPARALAAHDAADLGLRRVGLRRGARLRRLLDPRLAGDLRVGHAADAGRRRARSSTRSRRRRRSRCCARSPTRSRASRTAATRAASPGAPRRTSSSGSPTRRTSGPSASSSSSTRSRTTSARTTRTTRSTRPRATGTPASRGSATRSARRRATSRRRRTTRCTTCARGWC